MAGLPSRPLFKPLTKVSKFGKPLGGVPVWVSTKYAAAGIFPSLAADFINDRYWDSRLGSVSLAQMFSIVRSTVLYADDTGGTWTQFSPGFIARTNKGIHCWEGSTNSIRNNSMQGAVAGVVVTPQTVTAASRSASATAVYSAVNHNLNIGDIVSPTGFSIADYNGTFCVSAIVPNVSFSVVTATSTTDSATVGTYTAFSQGTPPTNWSVFTAGPSTFATAVLGVGTESNVDYVDIRIAGYAPSVQNYRYATDINSVIAAANGQTWTNSHFHKLIGGSLANVDTFQEQFFSFNTGALISQYATTIANPTGAALGTQRVTNTGTITDAGTTHVQPMFCINTVGAGFLDITLRIGLPQCEQKPFATPPIRTTSAAASRSADIISITSSPAFGSALSHVIRAVNAIGGTTSQGRALFDISDGTANNRSFVQQSSGDGHPFHRFVVGGVSTDANVGAFATITKISAGISAGSQSASLNGAAVVTAAPTSVPPLNQVNIGCLLGGNTQFDGYITELAIWANAQLSNAILQSLST